MNAARLFAVFAMVLAATACNRDIKNNESGGKEIKVTTLTIAKRQGDTLVPIGSLVFEGSQQGVLTTEKPGPEADELKQAWEELSSKKQITWKRMSLQVIDGQEVTAIDGDDFSPGDEEYKWAVLDNLERKYGYTVDSHED